MKEPQIRVTILGLHYSPEPSGNAPYTAGLAEGLARRGHAVTVVTGYPHYPEWQLAEGYTGWSQTSVINGVKVKRLRHFVPRVPSVVNRLHMELSFGLRLLFARWERPDVVLCVSPALFASGLAIIKNRLSLRRPALAIWVQDLYSRGLVETASASKGSSTIARTLEARILGSANGVVAIHERFRDYLVEALGVAPQRIRIIRNWTHLPPAPTIDRLIVRKKLGWALEDIVVLHAGNMGKKQGLENVVETARLAQQRNSPVHFVLMGDGNQRARLEQMAQGVDRVTFRGPLPGNDFQAAMAAADILLVNELPGVTDMSVPSKLTSYFDAGVPVLAATDAASVTAHEVAVSEGGLRVDPANPEALLEASQLLGADVAMAASLGAAGLRFRRETLSEQAALDHYDDFIKSLASLRGR